MIIKVERKQLLAAQLFRAYQDVRYYLNGLFFDKDGTLAATDGHRLFVGKHENQIQDGIIVSIKNKVPNKFEYAEIDTELNLIYYKSDEGENLSVGLIEIIDGNFPDYKKVIPKTHGEKHTSVIGFNTEYLIDVLKVGKIFNPKFPSVKILMPMDSTHSAVFEFCNEEAKVVVMPQCEYSL